MRSQVMIAAIAAAAVASAGSAQSQTKDFKQIAIGTLSVGSIYYASGGVIAKELGKKMPVPVNIQPFSGTTTSLALVDQGEIAMAIGASMEAHDAYKGIAPYRKMPNLRMVAILYPLYASMVVRNDSPIKSIKDLKGKRVAGSFPAMLVGRQLTASLLATEGLTWNDVTVVPTPSIMAALPLFPEGRIDSTYTSIGTAIMRELDGQVSGGMRFLPITTTTAAAFQAMDKAAPGTYAAPMKAGSSPGVRADGMYQAFDSQLIASTYVSDELVYLTIKYLAEAEKDIAGAFPPMREFAKAKFAKTNITVQYHPGAVKAFKELGLWTAELEAHNAALAAGK